jgi:hypothetical protein
MDKAESERIQELCSRIAVEQDRNKFLRLCEELNRLLSSRDRGPSPGSSQNDKPDGSGRS